MVCLEFSAIFCPEGGGVLWDIMPFNLIPLGLVFPVPVVAGSQVLGLVAVMSRLRVWLALGVMLPWPGHLSHTTPSPSPSRALGTIFAGNPRPPPWLPCTRVSPASSAASHDPYTVSSGSAVGLCSPVAFPRVVLTSTFGGFSHVPSMSMTISDSTGVILRPHRSFISVQSVA